MYGASQTLADPVRPGPHKPVGRVSLAPNDAGADFADAVAQASVIALEQTGVGLVLTDRAAQVRFSNSVARRLLEGSSLHLRHGRLTSLAATDAARLHRAIEAVTRAVDPVRSTVVEITGCDTVQPVRILSQPAGGEGPRLAMVMLVATPAPPEEARLRQVFNLTPAEARLLSALIHGERLAAYAGRSGVKLTTAKSHLRSLFAKTGEGRQADLIRRAITDPGLHLQLARARRD